MKKIIFIFILFVFSVKIKAQFPDHDTAYFYLFGGKQVEEFRDVANVSIDSGYISVGTTSSFGYGETDIYLVKTDWKCNTLWSRHFGSVNIDKGFAVKETYDKGFIIGGYTNGTVNGDYDMILIKTDSNGFEQWEKKFGGADWDFMYSLAIAPDSGFILCGETYSFGNNSSDVYLVRTDKNGNLMWEKNWGGVNKDCGNKVIITNDTAIAVAGYTESYGLTNRDAYFLKCDMNGDTIFTRHFGGWKSEEFNSIIQHSVDSGFVFYGSTASFDSLHNKDAYLLKISKTGSLLWYFNYGDPNNDDEGFSVIEITYGNLLIVGYRGDSGEKKDVWAVICSTSGYGFWGLFSPTYGSTEDDIGYASMLTKRNHYIIAGMSKSYANLGGDLNGNACLILADSIKGNQIKIIVSSDSLVGINTYQKNSEVLLFPNPAAEIFYLKPGAEFSSDNKIVIQITDLQGRVVLEEQKQNSGNAFLDVNVGKLSQGIYHVCIKGSSKVVNLPLVISSH